MSQTELALAIRKAQSTVASWEAEGGAEPTLDMFDVLARALGCSKSWLLLGEGAEATAQPADQLATAADKPQGEAA